MPNWVFNHLTVKGDSKDVDKVKAQLNSPFSKEHTSWNPKTQTLDKATTTYSNPVFAFWNIISPTNLEAYNTTPEHNSNQSEEAWKGDDWYHWNIRNWGCKWDVAISDDNEFLDTSMDELKDGGVQYNFDTAWSPPEQAIQELSRQYPNLTFKLYYEEEQGWGGEVELINGKEISSMQYEDKCFNCDSIDVRAYCSQCDMNVCSECNTNSDENKCTHDKSDWEM